jgi:hypothetical protein
MAEPRRSRLRQLLQKPEARPRLTRAVAALLGTGLVSIAIIGALTIWHLIRRGRLIRDALPPPRGPGSTDFCRPEPNATTDANPDRP